MKVPKKAKDLAFEAGYNRVKYSGSFDGANYYSASLVDENGFALPTGLPAFIKEEDGRYSLIDCEDGLALHRRLF